MQEILTSMKEGIAELLPGAAGCEVLPTTRLNRLPEWDSMTSVNFKIYLEETFSIKIPDELLDGEATVGEVIDFIMAS
jgi:acyl carrier protein